MVFVDQVVAVDDVLAEEVAETQEHPDGHVLPDHVDVLATLLVGRDRHAAAKHRAADDAAFLEVDVYGVIPTVLGVHQFPDFRAALADSSVGAIRVEEALVERPEPFVAIEDPAPHRCGSEFFRCQRA
ncbi:hypothetical protein D9M71_166820 [compost metagenome]